jgi:hypothetical protein
MIPISALSTLSSAKRRSRERLHGFGGAPELPPEFVWQTQSIKMRGAVAKVHLLDQLFFMRPMPGWSNHRTPIDGLYLCGNGVHGGGRVSTMRRGRC